MLDKDQTTSSEAIWADLDSRKTQSRIARNAMSVIYQLKICLLFVTRCARLHNCVTFLVDVSHGSRSMSKSDIERLADVLQVPVSVFFEKTTDFQSRQRTIGAHLKTQGRLLHDGQPVFNEAKGLSERYPDIARELEAETQRNKRNNEMPISPMPNVTESFEPYMAQRIATNVLDILQGRWAAAKGIVQGKVLEDAEVPPRMLGELKRDKDSHVLKRAMVIRLVEIIGVPIDVVQYLQVPSEYIDAPASQPVNGTRLETTKPSVRPAASVVWDGKKAVMVNGSRYNLRDKGPTSVRRQFIDRMRQLRDSHGLKQKTLESKCGLNNSMLVAIRDGRTYLDQRRAEAIAGALKVAVEDLFAFDQLTPVETESEPKPNQAVLQPKPEPVVVEHKKDDLPQLAITAEQFWSIVGRVPGVDSQALAQVGLRVSQGKAVDFHFELVKVLPQLEGLRREICQLRENDPSLYESIAQMNLAFLA